MGKYFGTDGFRGEANKNLNYEHAVKIGRYLGWYYGARLGKKAKVVIGKDTRRSSYMFEYALTVRSLFGKMRRVQADADEAAGRCADTAVDDAAEAARQLLIQTSVVFCRDSSAGYGV